MQNNWRLPLLRAYYWATLPARRRRLRTWAADGIAPITILFYHRVHEDRATPWTTHPRAFRRQIAWLLDHADLVSLQEAQTRLQRGNFSCRPTVAITFDDGYEDNLASALPLLIQHAVPCTYFVTAENVLRGLPFEHDRAYGVSPRPHTAAHIRDLAASGVEIGSHAWSHRDFGALDADTTRREFIDSRRALEDIISAPITRFAFPFGRPENAPPHAIALARECGYGAVCTAYGGYNVPPCDGFVLRRFHGDDPWIRMANRVTVDTRLLDVPWGVAAAAMACDANRGIPPAISQARSPSPAATSDALALSHVAATPLEVANPTSNRPSEWDAAVP